MNRLFSLILRSLDDEPSLREDFCFLKKSVWPPELHEAANSTDQDGKQITTLILISALGRAYMTFTVSVSEGHIA